ncbi:oxygen-dependent protoporphyrinogen oxidase [Paracoccus versutus]|uniref:Oxygen-dependent protoporphyrinogen oxidase n=1 Tax=Paracoccus versutus TaxID=34007 RepID=A0AAQ0HIZ2_PARVE|nr:hypothetical protein [Paracoccus versutus]KGJ11180.1 hypothetical protein IT40_08375 [Paracoccus versutus]REG46171.1 oxygen-dependent protoporphyrinogen oxidase [Paracoccus versutus]
MLAARFATNPDDATSAPAADGETLAAHVTRHLSRRVLERMVNPVFRGTRSWDAGATSAAFFATTKPHMIGRSTVHVLKGGMNSLAAALSRDLVLMLNTRPYGSRPRPAARAGWRLSGTARARHWKPTGSSARSRVGM